jgi:lipopolysaccharide transport system permease protein
MLGPFRALFAQRSLTSELAKRDVLGRYRGASFGLLWSLISPFLMLMVYTFAFGFVLRSRWPQAEDQHASFAIIIFVGLIVHGFFAECLTRSPTLITANPSFVKRVVFPLEILPWPMVISAFFHVCTNAIVFVLLRLLIEHVFSWTIIFLPLVMLPLVILTLGVSWMLAALGVYLRDITQVTSVLATAMLFLSSAIIPVQALPKGYGDWFAINPLTFIINQARAVMIWTQQPDWAGLGLYMLGALVVMYLGYGWFMATKRGFADVL